MGETGGAGTAYPPEHMRSFSDFGGIRVAKYMSAHFSGLLFQ
jgi:hypothetical protein